MAQFFVIVFGLLIGSFLNAVIHRLHSGESLFEKHSRCPKCHHPLAWRDLIPILSFLFLQGHCRYCRARISVQYPLVEFATAVAFFLTYTAHPSFDLILLFTMVLSAILLLIFVYDLLHYLILDKIIFLGSVLALIYQIYRERLVQALLGVLILAGFFYLLHLVSRGRWIGLGDVKLGIFLGLAVPFPETLALFFLAYLIGALTAIALMIAGKKQMSDRLPFGTFLSLAAFITLLWGREIVAWYLLLIGF